MESNERKRSGQARLPVVESRFDYIFVFYHMLLSRSSRRDRDEYCYEFVDLESHLYAARLQSHTVPHHPKSTERV